MGNPFSILSRCLEVAALTAGVAFAAAAQQAAGASVEGTLLGTVVLEQGGSFALFGQQDATWRVREGEEVSTGTRLSVVKTDRIVVETGGVRREILLFPGGLPVPVADPVVGAAANDAHPDWALTGDNGASPGWVRSLTGRAERIRARMEQTRQRWVKDAGPEGAAPPAGGTAPP